MSQAIVNITGFWQALAIGILVFVSTFMAMHRVFPMDDRVIRKASAVFVGAAGFLVTTYLLEIPASLGPTSMCC